LTIRVAQNHVEDLMWIPTVAKAIFVPETAAEHVDSISLISEADVRVLPIGFSSASALPASSSNPLPTPDVAAVVQPRVSLFESGGMDSEKKEREKKKS
jgi:hypothetical protein